VVDLVVFYIAKARIDSVNGASAKIGICVWFTLVAWILPVIAGCCCSINAVENRRKPKAPRQDDEYPQSAGGYARVPGPPMNKFAEREVSVPLANDPDSKMSGDEDDYYRSNNATAYNQQQQQHPSIRDPHHQPRQQVTGAYPQTTYPPHQDPYSTGYYREYGVGDDDQHGGSDLGAATFAGVGAGAAAVTATAYGGNRTPSAQGYGHGNGAQSVQSYGYDGYPPAPVQGGYDQQGQGHQGYPRHQSDDGCELKTKVPHPVLSIDF
jgi:hypothetical protein